MGGQKHPFIKTLQSQESGRIKVPKDYEKVLAVKRVVETHRSTGAISGFIRGSAKAEPQNDC